MGKTKTPYSLGRLLKELNAEVARVGRPGPFGAYLEDHLFFDGWDAWGSKIPAPISSLAPVDVLARAEGCRSSDDHVSRLWAEKAKSRFS